jgi:hypothetical protein
MRNKKYFGLLGLVIAVFSLSMAASAQNAKVQARAEQISGDRFTYVTITAKGAGVYSVKRPSAAMLTAIDKGLSDLFAVARKNGYRTRLNFADYTIYIAKPDRSKNADGQYSPDIAVGAAQYAGSEYDKGGYIYAAGMVVAFSPSAFLIGEHTSNFSRVSDVVRFEGEHIVLYHNDRRRYNETSDHSRGGGHPILQ